MMHHWRELLLESVSPLESGVRNLDVSGYRPPGEGAFRPARTAAVLVPLLDMHEPQVVLTRRADHLPQHPGQVSFPGGAAEDADSSAVQTALREAYEEIGLPPAAAKPIGFLDRMDTISDYRVLPVVALVTPPVQWVLDQREVAEVFTVPLSVVLDVERYDARIVARHGREYTIHTLKWQHYIIWGATADMLLNLISRMQARNEQRNSAFERTAE
ncbi:MAG: CoA pyrophosphatase [Xanthomonadales bacterium]|nr:CoA pyrophosphatase [Gammaproteobacteria bacterium]MBT8054663.1 CoA pyrophosphatase [Gammaproteobacteria bacterium]NND55753.1 CoA pyrophosphatase [Xanthomonadales bacterium]NNK50164.1 CoA pyrophosphatase [Xanthomonadales bacterium]